MNISFQKIEWPWKAPLPNPNVREKTFSTFSWKLGWNDKSHPCVTQSDGVMHWHHISMTVCLTAWQCMCVCVCVFPQGELRISVLPTYLSYDAPWPVRKIPLRCTVHYVSYHVESKVRLPSVSPHSTRGSRAATWHKLRLKRVPCQSKRRCDAK